MVSRGVIKGMLGYAEASPTTAPPTPPRPDRTRVKHVNTLTGDTMRDGGNQEKCFASPSSTRSLATNITAGSNTVIRTIHEPECTRT